MLSGLELWCGRLPATQLHLPSAPAASLPKTQQPFPPLPSPEHTRGLPAGGTPGEEPSSRDQWVLAPLHWACKTEGSASVVVGEDSSSCSYLCLRGGWGSRFFSCSLVPFPEVQWRLPVLGASQGSKLPLHPHMSLASPDTKIKPKTFYILPFLEQQMKIPETNTPWPVLPPLT